MINESLSLTLSSSLSLFSSTPSTKLTSSHLSSHSSSSCSSSNTSNEQQQQQQQQTTSNSSLSSSSSSSINNTSIRNIPILHDLLAASMTDMIPYVFDFHQVPASEPYAVSAKHDEIHAVSSACPTTPIVPLTKKKHSINKRKKTKHISSLQQQHQQQQQQIDQFCLSYYNTEPSVRSADYFAVEPEHTRQMEVSAPANSLFLALARSFLYKYYFENKKYEFIIRLFCLNSLSSKFKLDSDIALQQVLRKKLCNYWLSFVREGKFIKNCKYSNLFNNVCDFIYQVYQISVNNFSENRLFEMCALDDLADLFDVNILVFNTEQNNNEAFDDDNINNNDELSLTWKYRVHRPSYDMLTVDNETGTYSVHDYVYLSVHKQSHTEKFAAAAAYKWLVPNSAMPLVKKNLLNPLKQDAYFVKTNANYAYQFLLLDSQCLFKCFGDSLINTNLNLLLFLNFLSECSVHTLTSLRDLNFDDLLLSSEDPNDMINYLNQLWGQNHFSLKEILKKLDLKKDANCKMIY